MNSPYNVHQCLQEVSEEGMSLVGVLTLQHQRHESSGHFQVHLLAYIHVDFIGLTQLATKFLTSDHT